MRSWHGSLCGPVNGQNYCSTLANFCCLRSVYARGYCPYNKDRFIAYCHGVFWVILRLIVRFRTRTECGATWTLTLPPRLSPGERYLTKTIGRKMLTAILCQLKHKLVDLLGVSWVPSTGPQGIGAPRWPRRISLWPCGAPRICSLLFIPLH